MRFPIERLSIIGLVLALLNIIGCLFFVFSRPPIDTQYLLELDKARAAGHFVGNDAISGIVACRAVGPWGNWHGLEVWYVKVLEIANLDIVIPLMFASAIFNTVSSISTCTLSWIIAVLFLSFSAVQWFLIGRFIQSRVARSWV